MDWRDREGTAWSEADVIPVFVYEYLCQLGARIIHPPSSSRNAIATTTTTTDNNNNNNNTATARSTSPRITSGRNFPSFSRIFKSQVDACTILKDVREGDDSSVGVVWRECRDRPFIRSPRNHLNSIDSRTIRSREIYASPPLVDDPMEQRDRAQTPFVLSLCFSHIKKITLTC